MAELISAQTTAATSADFTVTSSPVGVSCYGAKSGETVGIVNKKMSDGNYYPLMFNRQIATLTGENPDLTITKPGTYQFVKFVTASTVGVDKDE